MVPNTAFVRMVITGLPNGHWPAERGQRSRPDAGAPLTNFHQHSLKNSLLASLPPSEFEIVATSLTRIDLELGEPLHGAGERIEYVHFPETGFVSAMSVLTDGAPLEIGLIGAEGVVGVSALLGASHSYCETMCQTGGAAHRMPIAAFIAATKAAPHLCDALLRYAHVFQVQVAQTAACNAHHDVGERLARWLLAAHDRSGRAELSLTQDLISVMLGVRRSTVSVAASILQKAGVIRYQHGRITVTNRIGLENAACECYEVVVSEYARLFGTYPFAEVTEDRPLPAA